MNMMKSVLIVGAGPVGLLLALMLRRYAVDVTIIEKRSQRKCQFSRALTLSPTSLRAFHIAGIIDELLTEGAVGTSGDVFYRNKRVAKIDLKCLDDIYNYFLCLPQEVTEKILENHLKNKNIEVLYQHELLDIDQNDDCNVSVKIKIGSDDVIRKYGYVIGCDGAHSKVRSFVSGDGVSYDYQVRFFLSDVVFKKSAQINNLSYYVRENGFVGFFPITDNLCRVVVSESNEAKLIDNVSRYLLESLEHVFENPNAIIDRVCCESVASIKSLVVDKMQHGRLLLAGDAAHLFSPVGGQTLNTGIQDAIELAWRLGEYISGYATSCHLHAYESERQKAVRKVFSVTDYYTHMIMSAKESGVFSEDGVFSRSRYKHFKRTLPFDFSGYTSDYSIDGSSSLAGKHVPYFEFSESSASVKNIYDLLALGKSIVFLVERDKSNLCVKEIRKFYRVVTIIFISSKVGAFLKLATSSGLLVSPSGYVVLHGELSLIVAYLRVHYAC